MKDGTGPAISDTGGKEWRHMTPAEMRAELASEIPPPGGVYVGYALPPRAPNDPPETWLDRRAGEALAGLCADPNIQEGADEIAFRAYSIAEAMLAEKRRREKKEVAE